ncbi:outer-membrane lipoprotein carrier protein LolA [Caulobacter sp. 17J65-9]|uniref:LolA family protein n=1 Tax=Caulobacter sp. 17J65-9 TaxID=2709382 RepID=UPI0013CBB657|nr:outer-membrane lipoprotein carrier protein LolA [Caulobacter sp. 17J65-9]NEX92885.1 outer membrane lipoprotein carrier protein LolA [Caulobacter sp. 17J65-9]
MKTRTALLASIAALGAAAVPLTASLAAPARAQAAQAAPLSAEDKALVDKAAAYLQQLDAAKGRFVQTDARGARSEGDFWLKRPGKVRFAYDKGLLVVSDGFNVNIHDPRLKTFDRYPLSATPLQVFLAKQIRLDKGVKVDRVTKTADGFQITARDAKRPGDGSITLAFIDGPNMRLKEWTVADAQGQRTRVQLTTLEPTSGLNNDLFVLRDPSRNAGRS